MTGISSNLMMASWMEVPGAVIGKEGVFLIVADLVDVQFVFFFYNVGSHNVLFKMDEKSNPLTPHREGLLFSF
jgi:hypothetical protein